MSPHYCSLKGRGSVAAAAPCTSGPSRKKNKKQLDDVVTCQVFTMMHQLHIDTKSFWIGIYKG